MTAAHDTQALADALSRLTKWAVMMSPETHFSGDHPIAVALDALASRLQEQEGQPAPIAWEATTSAYIKFITQERYSRFAPAVQRWYKPYRCSSCATLAAGSQAVQVTADKAQAARYEIGKWLNEGQLREINRQALADLCAGFDQLERAVQDCTWSREDDDRGTWRTGCGNLFAFTDDGPSENRFKHCCYCGGKMALQPLAGGEVL